MFDEISQAKNQRVSNSDAGKKALVIGGVVLLLSGAGFGIWKALPKDQGQVESQTQQVSNNKQTQKQAAVNSVSNSGTGSVASQPSVSDAPTGDPEDSTWRAKKFTELTKADYENSRAVNANNLIGQIAGGAPSEKDGFTSDPSKAYEDNGIIPNKYYTYLTAEEMERQLTDIIYRIIDPVYGGWNDVKDVNNSFLDIRSEKSKNLDFNKLVTRDHKEVVKILPNYNSNHTGDKLELDFTVDKKSAKVNYKLTLEVEPKKLSVIGGKYDVKKN